MTSEDAEEYTQALGQVVAGGYRQIALGLRLGVAKALKLSPEDWVQQRLGGYVKYSLTEKTKIIRTLADEGFTWEEIQCALGTGPQQISAALRTIENSTRRRKSPRKLGRRTILNSEPVELIAGLATTNEVRQQIESNERKASAIEEKRARKTIPDAPLETDAYRIIHGNLTDIALESKVDWIITDPPYGKDAIALCRLLGRWAATNLKPGGSCLVMVGQFYLPDVLTALTAYLRYHWTLAWTMPGGQPTQIWGRNVNCFWKPIIWLVNEPYHGEYVTSDVFENFPNASDKTRHRWGQAEEGFAQLIEHFTFPGETICDPFCGGGTTGAAAVKLRRKFIGIDVDGEAIETTRQRLAELEVQTCSEKSN